MRLDERDAVSVTGGMTFAGGPLNNFVLQAIARMAGVLRADPGSTGIVTAVSGILTKQGVSLWSSEPSEGGFHYDDVGAAETERVEVVGDAVGPAAVTSYTVLHFDAASVAVVLGDLPDGRRVLVQSDDADLIAAGERDELCGRTVVLSDGGVRLASA
jgi:acetyl-CoA C-acetyltransferase